MQVHVLDSPQSKPTRGNKFVLGMSWQVLGVACWRCVSQDSDKPVSDDPLFLFLGGRIRYLVSYSPPFFLEGRQISNCCFSRLMVMGWDGIGLDWGGGGVFGSGGAS